MDIDIDFALFRQVADNVNDERNVVARFYDKAVKTQNVTPNGLPIFKNVTYVEIRLKDNSSEIFNQPATKEKILRFPREYSLYKMAKEKVKSGTPIEQFAFLSAAEVATCKNRGIFTVEELADLDENHVKNLGLQNEHNMAVMFVQQARKNNMVAEFARKEQNYKDEIEKLKDEIAELKQQIKMQNKFRSLKKNTYKQGGK